MRAAIYARFSSELQRAASIDDQARNCRKRAEAEGWAVETMFADAAISGSDSNRPQYLAMLAAASKGEFNVLLVEDLSRLARDSVEQERAIRRLEFQGIRVLGISDGYDSDSKARKVHRGVRGLMNELFLDDLRDKTHRGQIGQALKHYWPGGRPFGYKLQPVLDTSKLDQYGQPARIGTKLTPDKDQAPVVQEIFERYGNGESCLAIARALNARGVPSPGSSWKRTVRRCEGWMTSAVRTIVRNSLYTGLVHWNTNQYVRDPDSGKYKRRVRPREEWVEYRDEALRLISDAMFAKAQSRTQVTTTSDERVKSGGKAKFLLSGLLQCAQCGQHYVMADNRGYACSGHRLGGACSNKVRIRRDVLETAILTPIRKDLLSPERVARMAQEMQAAYAARLKANAKRAETMPKELAELTARIERLRERLRRGDPDMPADELQAAIDRAEAKRRELEASQPEAKQSARVLTILPRAAEMYRNQIALGLDGDPRQALKARVILRQLFGGKIVLAPGENGSLWAEYVLHPAILLKAAGTVGGAEGDRAVTAIPVRIKLK